MSSDLSPAQMRMARALLDMSREDVEAAIGIAKQTLLRIENNAVQPRNDTLKTIRSYFEGRGIEFSKNDGVARRDTNIRQLRGTEALTDLLEDVYETVKNGGDICISGVDEDVFEKHYIVRSERHSQRMARIADKVSCRAIIKQGDYNFAYTGYVQYRWMPKEHFKENAFYLYNDKLAFIQFLGDGCDINIISSAAAATAFRDLFDYVWLHCSDPPKKREAIS